MSLLAELIRWIFGAPEEEDAGDEAYMDEWGQLAQPTTGYEPTEVTRSDAMDYYDFPSPADAASQGGGGGYGYAPAYAPAYGQEFNALPLLSAGAEPLGQGGGGYGGGTLGATPYYGPIGAGAILGEPYAPPPPSWSPYGIRQTAPAPSWNAWGTRIG